MKHLTYLAVMATVAAVGFGCVAAREHELAAEATEAPAYTYGIVTLSNPHPAAQQTVLNQWAASGWELITVDERQAYFKKPLR